MTRTRQDSEALSLGLAQESRPENQVFRSQQATRGRSGRLRLFVAPEIVCATKREFTKEICQVKDLKTTGSTHTIESLSPQEN